MGSWKQIAALPNPRIDAASCFHAGKVYVLGGRATPGGSFQTTTYVYDPAGNTWSTGAAMPTSGLCHAFSTPADGVHIVFPATGAHYAYDPDTNTWAARTAVPVPTRSRPFYFTDAAGRFYLAAGTTPDVDRYDPTTDAWTSRADAPSGPIPGISGAMSAGVLGSDNKIYLGTSGQSLRVYNPTADTWATTSDAPLPYIVGNDLTIARLPNGTIITLPRTQLSGLTGSMMFKRIDGYDPATATWTMGVIPDYPGNAFNSAVATESGGIVYLLGGQVLGSGSAAATSAAWTYKQNEPPTAPTPKTLTGGVTVSTAVKNRASWTFNDPNAGDSQSGYVFYYRPTSGGAWTEVESDSPNPWYDFAAGSLEPAEYEWQVEVFDAAGDISPRTTSAIFIAADPPAGPTITYPINGQTVQQLETVTWSVAAQDIYRLRRVADDAGDPDTGTVYFDTGEVAEPLTRTLQVEFDTNDRFEHLLLEVKSGGLWSAVADVLVEVSYTEPPVPTFTAYPDEATGSLLIMISNPDPGEDQPGAAYNDVYIDDGDGFERKATEVATNTGWRYWTPRSGRDYSTSIRIIAVSANGTTASSS